MAGPTEAQPQPIVTRAEAIAKELSRYYTGRPCKHGHLSERLTKLRLCIACNKIACAKHYARNSDKICERQRLIRASDGGELYRAARRARYANNPEKILAFNAKWKENNPEKAKASVKAARRKKPEKKRISERTRKAKLKNATGIHYDTDIADIRRLQRDRCAICRKPLRGKGTVDHIQPVSRGGSNDRRNLQLVHGTCNSKKSHSDPLVFARKIGLLL